jgi:hypothetical protein
MSELRGRVLIPEPFCHLDTVEVCIPFAFRFESALRIPINSSVFDAPESATLSFYSVDITVLRSFPSWTSPVRIPIPI